jgi:hypothetical protein
MYSARISVERSNGFGWAGLLAFALACGGGDVPPPPAGGEVAGGAPGPQAGDSIPLAQAEQIELSREVFAYRAGSRDPFRSLVESGQELRPFLEDLRVTSILYDARYPGRSLAVLRDTTLGDRYEVRVDDEFGRLRVAEIREEEVVLTIEEFGVPRQVVISLRRRREGNS